MALQLVCRCDLQGSTKSLTFCQLETWRASVLPVALPSHPPRLASVLERLALVQEVESEAARPQMAVLAA